MGGASNVAAAPQERGRGRAGRRGGRAGGGAAGRAGAVLEVRREGLPAAG